MKIPFLRYDLLCVAVGGLLLCAMPVLADKDGTPNGTDDGAMLKQAETLVKQAWNLGGDPMPAQARIDLLTKALDLIDKEPDHHMRHASSKAKDLINTAMDELKTGDPGNQAADNLRDADGALRQAIQNAESH